MPARSETVLKYQTLNLEYWWKLQSFKATTANVVCYMFILSDGVIGIENGQLNRVQY
jgi:hypothetical protein